MNEMTGREEELAAEISRLQEERPYLGNLLTSFGPMLIKRQQWLQSRGDAGRTFSVDLVKFAGGITLLQQSPGFLDDARWQDAGLAASGAIAAGFPELAGDMGFLSDRIRGGFDCLALYRSSADLRNDELHRRAAEIGIAATSLVVFLRSVGRLMLGLRREEMASEIVSMTWKKGYCPVCGSFPHLAIIREKGQRWLQCPQCSHEWSFPRMTCPYCEHEDPENSGFFFVEGKKEEMAYVCSECKKYLITTDQSGNFRHTPAVLLAISLAHLDLLVQEKGFRPMAECEWNAYQTEE